MNREAYNFHEDGEIIEAVQRYEEMLKTGEMTYFDVFEFEHIIDSFMDEGKFFQALKVVELGLQQHPASLNVLAKKAHIYLNIGEISNSLSIANNLLQIEDSNHELHLLKGSSHLLLGEVEEAENSFVNALKYSFDEKDDTLYNIGYAFEQSGNFKKAIDYYG